MIAYVIFLTVVAAVTDARRGIIPNWLTLPSLVLGAASQTMWGGVSGLSLALLGAVICGLIPWMMFRFTGGQAIGGGDVKLFAALGAWSGPLLGLQIELSAFFVLGLFALCQLAYQGSLLRVFINVLSLMLNPLLPKGRRRVIHPEALTAMRMGPAILVATLVICSRTYGFSIPWPV